MSLTQIITLAVLGLLIFWAVGAYNRLVRLRNAITNAFAQIDVQLKRRHDLIPNLVDVARKYLEHERETLERVTAAWSHEDQAGPAVETLLLRPTAVEELDLPAFEELLMLHELLLRRGSVSQHRAAAWELAA